MARVMITKEVIWLCKLLGSFSFSQKTLAYNFSDNYSSIKLVHNLEFHQWTKHIGIQFHAIKQKVANKHITIAYVLIVGQITNILTKGLSIDKFQGFVFFMGMVNEHWMGGKSTLEWTFLEVIVVVFFSDSSIVTLYSNLLKVWQKWDEKLKPTF